MQIKPYLLNVCAKGISEEVGMPNDTSASIGRMVFISSTRIYFPKNRICIRHSEYHLRHGRINRFLEYQIQKIKRGLLEFPLFKFHRGKKGRNYAWNIDPNGKIIYSFFFN